MYIFLVIIYGGGGDQSVLKEERQNMKINQNYVSSTATSNSLQWLASMCQNPPLHSGPISNGHFNSFLSQHLQQWWGTVVLQG